MAKQIINIGTVENDQTGDKVRTAFEKINQNINEIYTAFGDGSTLVSITDGDGVLQSGSPLGDQLAIWASDGVIEGDPAVTWNGTIFTVAGSINVTGTVEGRIISVDGTKLDGIESGATADMTGAEIVAAIDTELGSTTWQGGGGGGGGDVFKVGVPVNNQIGVWTGDGTIEGDTELTWDGTSLTVTGDIIVTGTVDGRDIATDGSKLDGIEAGAEANPTGAEIVTLLDTELGSSSWQTGGSSSTAVIAVSTSRALLLTDANDILEIDTSGGAVELTVPTNASVAFPIGTIINVTLLDPTNAATIAADTDVSINGVLNGSGTIDNEAYVGVLLYKRATDAWVAQGRFGTVTGAAPPEIVPAGTVVSTDTTTEESSKGFTIDTSGHVPGRGIYLFVVVWGSDVAGFDFSSVTLNGSPIDLMTASFGPGASSEPPAPVAIGTLYFVVNSSLPASSTVDLEFTVAVEKASVTSYISEGYGNTPQWGSLNGSTGGGGVFNAPANLNVTEGAALFFVGITHPGTITAVNGITYDLGDTVEVGGGSGDRIAIAFEENATGGFRNMSADYNATGGTSYSLQITPEA